MNSDFSDFIRFFPIFRLFPTFRLLDSTTLVKTLQTQIDRASHFRFFVFLYFWEDYFHKKAATWEIGAFGAKQVTCQTILSFEKDIGGSATIIWTNVSFQMNYFWNVRMYTVDENLPFDL